MNARGAATTTAAVVVVGGGPAGAYTAWALARQGVDVLVADRSRFPRGKPCAEFLSPQASRLLDQMGVLEEVERAGPAYLYGMTVHAPDGTVFSGRFGSARSACGAPDRGLALPREVLDTIVLDRSRAAGARIAEGVRVTDLLRDGDGRVTGVRARTAESETVDIRARLVVGADGLRSVVARRLGLARSARWPRRMAFVAHYRGVDGIGACGEMHVTANGYCGLADVGDCVTNVGVVVPATAARAAGGATDHFMDRWIGAHPALAARFARATRIDGVQCTGPFASRARRAWAPGAALVGDAADFYDPFTGEGIYAALRGGELLAPHVLDALGADGSRAADAALAAYDRERTVEYSSKWRVEQLVAIGVAVPAIFNHVARALGRRQGLADLLVGVAGDVVPHREVLRPGFLLRLLLPTGIR